MTLLAAGEDPMVKLLIGGAIAVAWVVAQVYGALTKKPDRRVPPSRPPRPSPPVPSPRQRPPLGPALPKVRRTPPPIVRQPPTRPAETPPRRQPAAAATQAAVAAEFALPKALSRPKTFGTLLRPRNLKKAIALTEVLGPPVAMRESTRSPAVVREEVRQPPGRRALHENTLSTRTAKRPHPYA